MITFPSKNEIIYISQVSFLYLCYFLGHLSANNKNNEGKNLLYSFEKFNFINITIDGNECFADDGDFLACPQIKEDSLPV